MPSLSWIRPEVRVAACAFAGSAYVNVRSRYKYSDNHNILQSVLSSRY